MLFGGGVFGLVLLAFWLWAIFDVISTDESMVRNLPKLVWLIVVILLSTIGAVAWLVLGRPQHARAVVRLSDAAPPADDHDRRARYAELDEELDRRLEAKRLAELDEQRGTEQN